MLRLALVFLPRRIHGQRSLGDTVIEVAGGHVIIKLSTARFSKLVRDKIVK